MQVKNRLGMGFGKGFGVVVVGFGGVVGVDGVVGFVEMGPNFGKKAMNSPGGQAHSFFSASFLLSFSSKIFRRRAMISSHSFSTPD